MRNVCWVWARKRDRTLKRKNCQVSAELDSGGKEKRVFQQRISRKWSFKEQLENCRLLKDTYPFFYHMHILYAYFDVVGGEISHKKLLDRYLMLDNGW